MSVDIGMIGRDVTATVGGGTLSGVVTKATERTNEILDATDDDALGWQSKVAKAGVKGINFTMSGFLKNLELVKSFYGTSQIFEIVVTYTDGSVETFDAALENINDTGESNGLFTFDASFTSSGVSNFVAGT